MNKHVPDFPPDMPEQASWRFATLMLAIAAFSVSTYALVAVGLYCLFTHNG